MTNQVIQKDTQKNKATTVSGTKRAKSRRSYIPRVNIYETNNDIVLVADMPGVDENSVDVAVAKNHLTIKGTVEDIRPNNYDLAYAEYGVGDYYRQFNISNRIEQDKIEAIVRNGVVTINLPKTTQAKTRKIAVQAV